MWRRIDNLSALKIGDIVKINYGDNYGSEYNEIPREITFGVNEEKVRADLNAHPEVIAEALQTILRREGVAMPYEKLKALTRGKEVTLHDMHAFIGSLDVSPKVKKELLSITPENYIGLAEKIANTPSSL